MDRDGKPDNTKENEQETNTEKGQVETLNEELEVDVNDSDDEINKVKCSEPFDLKAELTKVEEDEPEDERQLCSSPSGDMADSDGHTSDAILSLTNQDIGEQPAIQTSVLLPSL